jgi:hypothetical protein
MSEKLKPHALPEATPTESERIRLLEAKLRETEERQALLPEGVKDFAIFSMDADGHIT